MYILFEDYLYPSGTGDGREDVQRILRELIPTHDLEGRRVANFVGYYYSSAVQDCVFILPKVLLKDIQEEKDGKKVTREALPYQLPNEDEERYVKPENIITPAQQEILGDEYQRFLYEFSVWIYRAICTYRTLNPSSNIVQYRNIQQSGFGKRHIVNTYLDIFLSLIRFNEQNQDFFMYTIHNQHSGFNKINWNKTISRSTAYFQSDRPVYTDVVNKKRSIDFDEELFIIFFSILNYLNDHYGFHTPINCGYKLLSKRELERYMEGRGIKRLREIKYKYFSDKALELWDLCAAFFDISHRIAVSADAREYLLVKKFNIVFEAMIDELVGEPRINIPKGLKDQDDGKRVDHMYTDLALTVEEEKRNQQTYFIGDSKYYKIGHKLPKESISKQYTYARNVVQWNINLFLDERPDDIENEDWISDKNKFNKINLRDKDTEGYNIIPNFFISAQVKSSHKYDDGDANIRQREQVFESKQFDGRLFDRDTLLLAYYDVNFLYIIYLYARNKSAEKAIWKQKVRAMFRKGIQEELQKRYKFYSMQERETGFGDACIDKYFRELNGKLFRPFGDDNYYSLAIEKVSDNEISQADKSLLRELEPYFAIAECEQNKMDNIPVAKLKEKLAEDIPFEETAPTKEEFLPRHYLRKNLHQNILVGYYWGQPHLNWIQGENNKHTLIYNVRMSKGRAKGREGSATASGFRNLHVKYVILYTDDYASGNFIVYQVSNTFTRTAQELVETFYPWDQRKPAKRPSGDYFLYRFIEQVKFEDLDKDKLIELIKNNPVEGQPIIKEAENFVN